MTSKGFLTIAPVPWVIRQPLGKWYPISSVLVVVVGAAAVAAGFVGVVEVASASGFLDGCCRRFRPAWSACVLVARFIILM